MSGPGYSAEGKKKFMYKVLERLKGNGVAQEKIKRC